MCLTKPNLPYILVYMWVNTTASPCDPTDHWFKAWWHIRQVRFQFENLFQIYRPTNAHCNRFPKRFKPKTLTGSILNWSGSLGLTNRKTTFGCHKLLQILWANVLSWSQCPNKDKRLVFAAMWLGGPHWSQPPVCTAVKLGVHESKCIKRCFYFIGIDVIGSACVDVCACFLGLMDEIYKYLVSICYVYPPRDLSCVWWTRCMSRRVTRCSDSSLKAASSSAWWATTSRQNRKHCRGPPSSSVGDIWPQQRHWDSLWKCSLWY